MVHDGKKAERLLAAFRVENHHSEFDWEKSMERGALAPPR